MLEVADCKRGLGSRVGILRLYLALSVFVWHYLPTSEHRFLFSFSAVCCFFILSGFYIAMAVSRTYGNTAPGVLRFYSNRALRLYPTYFAVLLASAVLYGLGMIARGVPGFNGADLSVALNQFSVWPAILWSNVNFATGPGSNTLAIGQYYTVGLEMMFYLVAPFVALRSTRILALLFGVVVAIHFAPHLRGLPERQWQYEFFPATLMFFLAGVLSYRLYLHVEKWSVPLWLGWLPIPLIAVYGWFFDASVFTNSPLPIAFYAAIAGAIPFLFLVSRQSRLDRLCGEVTYPFYVVQGLAVGLLGGSEGSPATAFGASLLLTLALAIALLLLVERPIEGLRAAVRSRSDRQHMSEVTSLCSVTLAETCQ